MQRRSSFILEIVLAAVLLPLMAGPAAAGEPIRTGVAPKGGGGTGNTVGIRMTISSVNPALSSVDLDLIMYTRGFGPSYAGSTFFGTYPAIDYGDGNTVLTVPLALTSSGGGPGGSNVYRNLTSFSHTYPGPGVYTARATMACVACFRTSYAFFPPGSPAPTAFSYVNDYLPSSVIGNLAGTVVSAGTSYYASLSTNIRYSFLYHLIVTNTTPVLLGSSPIPTVSEWGLAVLGTALLAAGVVLLRRRAL
jgi:hypothetical protein